MIALECALEEEDFFHFLSLLKMLTLKKTHCLLPH